MTLRWRCPGCGHENDYGPDCGGTMACNDTGRPIHEGPIKVRRSTAERYVTDVCVSEPLWHKMSNKDVETLLKNMFGSDWEVT